MARKQASTAGNAGSGLNSPTTRTTTSSTTAIPSSPNPSSTASPSATTITPSSSTTKSIPSSSSSSLALQDIIPQIWNSYVEKTPQRTKLIDAFMGFLLVVGIIQFVYCVLFGNYPYNAFLSGFGITVGQFVLTASLRIQTNSENAGEFKSVSPERAFADYVLGSLVLHFFCVNFIN